MVTKKNAGRWNAAWLKWAVVPLLAFLLAGWATKKLLPTQRAGTKEPFQKTVAASLKKLDSGDRVGALDGLVRAGKMAPNDTAGQMSLIPRFVALGEHKLAAEAMERSLRGASKEKQVPRSYTSLGEYLLEHGDIDNAKRILTGDLMARWPDAFETSYFQGEVALQVATGKDDIAAAAKLLQKCVKSDPGHVPSKLQLGIAYSRLGDLDKADLLLREVLEKRPFDPVVLYHLAEVFAQQGKTAEAAKYQEEHKRVSAWQERRKHLEAQYALKQDQPEDLLELSRLYVQLGEFTKAASTLRVYVRQKPTDPEGQRELAQVCLKIDDKEGARRATELADALSAAPKP